MCYKPDPENRTAGGRSTGRKVELFFPYSTLLPVSLSLVPSPFILIYATTFPSKGGEETSAVVPSRRPEH